MGNLISSKTYYINRDIKSVEIRNEAIRLGINIVKYMTNEDEDRLITDDNHRDILNGIMSVYNQHKNVIHNVVSNMLEEITNQTDIQYFIIESIDVIFSDNIYNWGRILTIYATCGCIAKLCKERKIRLEDFGNFVGNCISTKLGGWILKQGGWNKMDLKFDIFSTSV